MFSALVPLNSWLALKDKNLQNMCNVNEAEVCIAKCLLMVGLESQKLANLRAT